MPIRNRAWSSTTRILRDLVERSPVRTAASAIRARCSPWHSCALLSSRGGPVGIARRTTVPPSGRDRTSNRAPISSARSRMNWSPKLRRPRAATAPMSKPRPSSRTSRTQSSLVEPGRDRDVGRRGVLADILQGLLGDAQGDRPLASLRSVGRGLEVGRDVEPGQRRACARPCRVIAPSRPSSSSIGGRSWLMNARTSPSSRRSSSRRKRQLGAGEQRVGLDDPLDVLDLEDRVAERLGRAVVDLLGEPRALGLLGLDDAHLEVARGRRARRPRSSRVASPRSRKSHVRSRVRSASSSLAELGLAVAEVDRSGSSTSPRRAAPAGVVGAGLGGVGGAVDRRGRWSCRGAVDRRAIARRRARRAAPATGRAPRRRPRGSARARCASVFAL